jgi:hypothetical protein
MMRKYEYKRAATYPYSSTASYEANSSSGDFTGTWKLLTDHGDRCFRPHMTWDYGFECF